MVTAVHRFRFLPALVYLLLISLSPGCRNDPTHERDFEAPILSGSIEISGREDSTLTTLDAGDVLLLGGFDESGNALSDVVLIGTDDIADPMPALPQERARHSALAIEGGARVAIAGGVRGSRTAPVAISTTLIYDPSTGTSQAGPGLPEALSEMEAVLWNGDTPADFSDDEVFLIGGRSAAGSPRNLVLRWNLAAGTLAVASTLASPRVGHSATLSWNAGGEPRIYVIGGDAGSGPLETTEVIDPVTGAVSSGPDLPGPRARHASAPIGNGEAVLVAGGLGAGDIALEDGLILRTDVSPETITGAGRFGPAAFDLLLLPLGDGGALVLGGFTALEEGAPAHPVKEAALFAFDSSSGEGEFLDLPDFDLGSGAGAPAGAVRPGNDLGAEGTGTSVVLAGGRGSLGELRGALYYNPYNAGAAHLHDLTAQVGRDKALVGAILMGIFGIVENTRDYSLDRRRDIDVHRTEDPVRGTLVHGSIGEEAIDLEMDGGMIYGQAGGEGFVVYTRGDQMRAGGRINVQLEGGPQNAVEGRYFLDWKKNSVLVQVWKIKPYFEGRIASDELNMAVGVEDDGTRTSAGTSFFDNRELQLDRSR